MVGYVQATVAVDPVIFTIVNGELKVLLKRREKMPFKNKYELPGGLLREAETAEQTLQRKLREVLGERIFFAQFNTFTNPKRDPRSRVVSIGYVALTDESKATVHREWFSIDSLPDLAFDHKEIIVKAYYYLQNNLNSQIVKQFLPEKFPLNRLQQVHEIITRKSFDNRNFRKKMIAAEVVKETKEIEENVSHRPATLYKFNM